MKFNEYEARILNRITEELPTGYFKTIDLIKTLRRLSHKLQRIAENECNGHPKEVSEVREGRLYRYNVEDLAWKERDEKAEVRTTKKLKELAEEHGFTVELQGDPRGAIVTVKTMKGTNFTDLIY